MSEEITAPEAAEAEETNLETEVEEQESEQEASAPSEESDAPPPPKKSKGVQKRIDELTREKYEALRRAEFAEQQLSQRPQSQQLPDVGPRPKLEDFAWDEAKYNAAVDEWHDKRYQAQVKEQQKSQETAKQHQERIKREASYLTREELARRDIEDYDQVVRGTQWPCSDAAAEAIQISEAGPQIAYYLASHPEEAWRLYELPPVAQAYEIARIEGKLSAAPPPKSTKAPPPPPKVGGQAPVQKSPDKMTTAEWMAARNKQLQQR